MSKGLSLTKAKNILKKLPKKFIPVGSIVYRKPNVGDIDLITVEDPTKALQILKKKLDIISITARGKKKLFFIAKVGKKQIKFNVWFYKKKEYPYMYFSKIYPTKFHIKIRNILKKAGFTLSDYHIKKGNNIIKSFKDSKGVIRTFNKPRDFFAFANLYGNIPYRSPHDEYLKELKGGDVNEAIADVLAEGDGLLTNDPNRQLERKEEEGITKEIKEAIKTITTNPKHVIPFGSWIYRSQLYPGDIDLIEIEEECCDREEASKKLAKQTQNIVKNIIKRKGYYLGDVKAGIDQRFNINIGSISYSPSGEPIITDYNPNRIKNELIELYNKRLLTKQEFNFFKKLAVQSPTEEEYEELKDALRDKWLLRWSKKELLQGYKILPGNIKYSLSEAILDPTMTKIDMWTNIGGRYLEISNVLTYYLIDDEGKRELLNFANDKINLAEILTHEVQKFAFSKHYLKPFKMVKRMWSIARMRKDYEVIEHLTPLMQSDLGRLSQINSEIETLMLILKNVTAPPLKTIQRQIDGFKTRLQNVYEIPFNDKLIFKTINLLLAPQKLNKSIKERMIKKLKSIKDYFTGLINEYTLKYLKKFNLYPPPTRYLPTGAGCLECGGEGLASKAFQKASNTYRKHFCRGKARQLLEGEYHPGCFNFCGPGTKIELEAVRNYKPYNNVDDVCRTHDIDYYEANKNPSSRAKMIREADLKMLKALEKYKDEEGYKIAKKAITSKIALEDLAPDTIKSIFPSHAGVKGGEVDRIIEEEIQKVANRKNEYNEASPYFNCKKYGIDCDKLPDSDFKGEMVISDTLMKRLKE